MKTFFIVLLLSCASFAQISNPGGSGAGITQSATVPATCTVGSVYFHTTTTGGAIGLYECRATNTWSGPPTVGGGITNTAGLNIFMLSDGTNAIGSGVTGDGTGNVTLPAGKSIGSSDTGTPKITFGTNSITANQPLTVNSSGSSSVAIGTDGSAAGSLVLANGSAAFHTTITTTTGANQSLDAANIVTAASNYTSGQFVKAAGNNKTTSSAAITAADLPTPYTTVSSGAIGALSASNGKAQFVICTATCDFTPPSPPAAGYQICAIMAAGVTGTITLDALANSAMYGKTDGSAYGTAGTGTAAASSAQGNRICIVGRDATHYEATGYQGTWTMN